MNIHQKVPGILRDVCYSVPMDRTNDNKKNCNGLWAGFIVCVCVCVYVCGNTVTSSVNFLALLQSFTNFFPFYFFAGFRF